MCDDLEKLRKLIPDFLKVTTVDEFRKYLAEFSRISSKADKIYEIYYFFDDFKLATSKQELKELREWEG